MRRVGARLESTGQKLTICWQCDDSPAAGSAVYRRDAFLVCQRHDSEKISVYKICTVGKVESGKRGGNRLTFESKGWNHYSCSSGLQFIRERNILLHGKFSSAHSEFLRGVHHDSRQSGPRKVANSIPTHFLRLSTAAGRSQLFARNRRSLLRATHPMLSFIYRQER